MMETDEKVISGFFTDIDRLSEAIVTINTEYRRTCFVTLNPIRKDGWVVADNSAYEGAGALKKTLEAAGIPLESRMEQGEMWKSKEKYWKLRSTKQADIERRCWILVDCDAGQEKGENSTDAQHQETLKMAQAVMTFLTEQGFPKPMLTSSGNLRRSWTDALYSSTCRFNILV